MKARTRIRERISYWFDGFMVRGIGPTLFAVSIVFIGLFAVVGVLRVLVVSVIPDGVVERGRGVLRQFWLTWLEMTDPGTQAYDIDSTGGFKVVAILAAILGIILLSSVIALMTTALDEKLRQLRAGRSRVIERDHTLILGWNDRMIEVLEELIEANESEHRPVIVIMADREKPWMDEYLRDYLIERGNTKIVTRHGLPASSHDLEKVAVPGTKSIIILRDIGLSGAERIGQEDLAVLKAIMAVLLQRGDELLNIVAEMSGEENKSVARALSVDEVIVVDAEDILAKLIVQCSRTEGLSIVYREMLSFMGAEMYLAELPGTVGMTFAETVFHLEDGIPLGVQQVDCEVVINPDPQRIVNEGERLLVLAEDDSTIKFKAKALGRATGGRRIPDIQGQRQVERELLIGWTRKSSTIITEFSDYIEAGSTIDLITRNGQQAREIQRQVTALDDAIDGISVNLLTADPHSVPGLGDLDLNQYDNVILLSQGSPSCVTPEHTDSETVTILLRLRQMLLEQSSTQPDRHTPEGLLGPLGGHPGDDRCRLVSEVLDPTNYELLQTTGVDDVVISNALVSSIIAQLSEDSDVLQVYDALFQEEGSEIYLKRADWYFSDLPARIPFWDVIEAAQQRNEVALGYRLMHRIENGDDNYGVEINPHKGEVIELAPDDRIVVVALDEL